MTLVEAPLFGVGLLFIIAFYVVAIVLGALVLRWIIAGGVERGIRGARQEEDPLVILQRRYARGEIDEAEYERRRQILGR